MKLDKTLDLLKTSIRRSQLLLEKPYQLLEDQTASQTFANQHIPPNVYQTWVNHHFGKTLFREITQFRSLNPDLNFYLYDNTKIEDYMLEFWGDHPIFQVYQKSRFGPAKADIFRVCILNERGGFYFDINKGCSCPIHTLLNPDSDTLISFEKNDCIILPEKKIADRLQHPNKFNLQWSFGFKKDHIITQIMIEEICEFFHFFQGQVFANPKNAILSFTGTGMLTRVIRMAFIKDPNLILNQAGIDYNGHAIPEMKGSWSRYFSSPAYSKARSTAIVV